jgi:hypothetical protein
MWDNLGKLGTSQYVSEEYLQQAVQQALEGFSRPPDDRVIVNRDNAQTIGLILQQVGCTVELSRRGLRRRQAVKERFEALQPVERAIIDGARIEMEDKVNAVTDVIERIIKLLSPSDPPAL